MLWMELCDSRNKLPRSFHTGSTVPELSQDTTIDGPRIYANVSASISFDLQKIIYYSVDKGQSLCPKSFLTISLLLLLKSSLIWTNIKIVTSHPDPIIPQICQVKFNYYTCCMSASSIHRPNSEFPGARLISLTGACLSTNDLNKEFLVSIRASMEARSLVAFCMAFPAMSAADWRHFFAPDLEFLSPIMLSVNVTSFSLSLCSCSESPVSESVSCLLFFAALSRPWAARSLSWCPEDLFLLFGDLSTPT